MGFKAPPSIMQKVMRFKALKYEEGGTLTIWGNPCSLIPLYIQIYFHKLAAKSTSDDELKWMLYHTAKFQTSIGFRIINERFGYAKTMQEKKQLLEFNTGQTEILGLGTWKFVRMDFDNNIFIVEGHSPYAVEFKRFFGMQKEPIDYFFCGSCAAAVETIIGKPMLAIESKCIAKGDKQCSFIIKPVNKWDKDDPLIRKNKILLKKAPAMEELGAKMKPYLGLPKTQ
ncbi:MAG TPA: 4-vinyl reductase [Candidatus Nanoarchaeia archaeon]|nr:4-vinyl reductase [Candidatus Nanoarchaeia archaeon]